MKKVIYIEEQRLKHQEDIRRHTLNHFPWEQVEIMIQPFLQGLYPHFATNPTILIELLYRIVYEAYVAGITTTRRHHIPADDDALERIIGDVCTDFALAQNLEERRLKLVLTCLVEVGSYWFQQGKLGLTNPTK